MLNECIISSNESTQLLGGLGGAVARQDATLVEAAQFKDLRTTVIEERSELRDFS